MLCLYVLVSRKHAMKGILHYAENVYDSHQIIASKSEETYVNEGCHFIAD